MASSAVGSQGRIRSRLSTHSAPPATTSFALGTNGETPPDSPGQGHERDPQATFSFAQYSQTPICFGSTEDVDEDAHQDDVLDLFSFLQQSKHNPDLTDPDQRMVGFVRGDAQSSGKLREAGRRRSKLRCVQSVVGLVVLSWPVQTVVFMVVIFDMVLTGISLSDVLQQDHQLYRVGDITIVIILAADVCLRWFAVGISFILPARNCKMNIFEAVLVPITIAEVTILQDLNLPVPLLRAMRPVLRGVRLIRVLVRTAGKGREYLNRLRHQVSGDRLRYMQDGFDLDLQYITPQILVMSDPAVGSDSILGNPLKEVAMFLNEKHANKYLLLNTTEKRKYPLAPFFGRYFHYPIMQDGVPTLVGLRHMVKNLDAWLRADENHTLAVHSKHNQGRVAIIVIALMLYRKDYRSATNALSAFEHHRKRRESSDMENIQTLDSASQVRFLDYFAHMCSLPKFQAYRPAKILRIQLSGLSNAHLLHISCFAHPNAGNRHPRKSAKSVTGLSDIHKVDSPVSSRDTDDIDFVATRAPKSLGQRVLDTIEEGAMDSKRSGAAPMPGIPIFSSSKQDDLDSGKVAVKTMREPDTQVAVARIWDLKNVNVTEELRLELHLEGEGGEQLDTGGRSWCCCRRRRVEGLRKFSAGMIFGCWLHTGLLEHDEVQRDKRASRGKAGVNRLELSFDRFAVDKAANAPSLRSLSTAMKLDIEFLVEKRIQLQDLDHDPPELHLVTSNVNMSEWEDLKWLTWVSEKVWPSFQQGFSKMIKDGVENARANLPGPLKNMAVRQCSFGDNFPRFGPICASSQNCLNGQDEPSQEVQLDIGLSYATETTIVLEVGYLAFGISQLKISGMLSLKFTPLLDEIPVFSAMQLFFLNAPDVEIRFTNVLEVANTSFLMDKIRSLIHSAINNRLVVPNVLNINWADPSNDDSVSWTSVNPSFVIRVTIVKARELRSASAVLVRDPEASVRISVGSQAVRTTAVRSPNPVWASSFDFVVYDARQHLIVQVYDTDFTGTSWVIGTVGKASKLPIAQVADEGTAGMWMPLHGAPGRAKSEIFIAAALFDLSQDPSTLNEALKSEGELNLPDNSSVAIQILPAPAEDEEQSEDVDGIVVEEGEEEPSGKQKAVSCALLVCSVLAGHLPSELGKPTEVELQVKFGDSEQTQPCADPAEGSEGALSEKTRKTVERLAALGLGAAEISKAMDEEVADVTRVMRRQQCNMSVQQKLCLMLSPSDFEQHREIHFSIVTSKKRVLAGGSMEMHTLLESRNGREVREVSCKTASRGEVKLHIDARLFTLLKRQAVRDDDSPSCSPQAKARSEEEVLAV